jgi:hypothetical protein
VSAPHDLAEVVVDDARLMLTHALTTGRQVPPAWVETIATAQAAPRPLPPDVLRGVARCHDGLARLIRPATPRTLRFLEEGKHRRLVQLLSALALTFLAGFVGLATLHDVGGAFSDFEKSSGLKLFENLLFQLCAAGLGATFAALFAVNNKLRERSLDPREMFSNWVRVMLGLVSGLVLAQLGGQGKTFGQPLLALLGGFSVDVVFQTLRRLVELAGSLVEAGPGNAAAVERDRGDVREAQVRTALAQQLVRLRATLPQGPATQALDAMLADLTPVDPATVPGRDELPPDEPPPDVPPDPPPPPPDPAPDPDPDPEPDPAPDAVADGRSDVTTPEPLVTTTARPARRRARG